MFKFSGKPRHIQPPVEATHFSRALVELGIGQIFARSPQAKGRVESAGGTFQDRLVTELRLAGASTIDEADAVLRDFLPPYNTRFAVPADLPEPAYRPWDGNRPLDEILCFKRTRKVARDNTVKYRWHTLQLLPNRERPSYAGVQWKSSNTPTTASRYAMRMRSSPASQCCPDPVHCALPTWRWLPRTFSQWCAPSYQQLSPARSIAPANPSGATLGQLWEPFPQVAELLADAAPDLDGHHSEPSQWPTGRSCGPTTRRNG